MEFEQEDLFSVPRFDPLSALVDDHGAPAAIIIGCSRNKVTKATTARQLYTSDRFQAACEIAEALGAPFYVLSGLHGLLLPGKTVEPYNVDLTTSDEVHKKAWRKKVAAFLRKHVTSSKVCVLAADSYTHAFIDIVHAQGERPLTVAPLQSLDENLRWEWHNQALAAARRYRDLKRLYGIIADARDSGRTFLLGDLSNRKLPARGVYIFVDLNERNFYGAPGRIVRIGTHAVSIGSKSTLKLRLRNHLGLSDGSGNHRGSIFRLHVGRALLEKEGAGDQLRSWGEGQHASADIRALERDHEMRVSNYLRALEVFILDIDDLPTKDSLRAAVERQLIALCSEELQPIDHASEGWLGKYSPMRLIVTSGLWNLRDVGRKYEPISAGSMDDILSRKSNQ